MNSAPIILRELRAESRRPLNHWLRVLSAASAIGMLALIAGLEPGNTFQIGSKLFTAIHTTVFVLIWAGVPLLTADCLAREKREGTLPLLFLTPLTARGVVIGKSLAHLLRALTLLLAIWPVLAIPLLLGGVTSGDVAAAASFEFSALLASFSAGLIASAWTKNWARAMILAEISAAGAFFLFGCGFVLCSAIAAHTLSQKLPWDHVGLSEFFESIFMLSTGTNGIWGDITHDLRFAGVWYNALGFFVFFNAFLFALAILIAGNRIQRVWQENPPSPRQSRLIKAFTTPMIFRGTLQKSLRRRLNKNPIAWLQRHSWSARLTEWGWFAFCMGIMTELITVGERNYATEAIQGSAWLGLTLLAGVAFSSVSSFRREKENGVLELLLVTPLTENQIVWGRIFGIWGQFAPAILLMAATRIYLWTDYRPFGIGNQSSFYSLIVFLGSFFLGPIFGLYFALRSRNLFVGWVQTCAFALGIPIFLTYLIVTNLADGQSWNPGRQAIFAPGDALWTLEIFVYLALWSLLAIAALKLLFKLLRSRKFTSTHPRA